ncbi:MAG: Ldh family oxidoreductase, partial [bacterium]|nr:Ldh family oxidoreductase [bacterium]
GRFIDYVKSSRRAPEVDEILVPGERSHRTRQRRLKEGIPVEDATWGRIADVARRLGVKK